MVVDDHALLAEALAWWLRYAGCVVEVVQPTTADDVMRAVSERAPTVVLLDLYLGEGQSSVALIPAMVATGTEVVVLTGVRNEVLLAECIEAGAVGVISKAAPLEQVVAMVQRAVCHQLVQPVGDREQLLARLRRARATERLRLAPFEQLTRREQDVLRALMDGRSAAEIAEDFVVSLTTVRSQIRSILQKLNVRSQLGAVALAHGARWGSDPASQFEDWATISGVA
jgi:DNA-binding NarL/FixJ family response regulator